jgi:hypothetical protein
MLEEIARHLVQLRLARRRDDHAEIERVPLKLRLHRERLDSLGSQVMNTFCAGCRMSAFLAEK